MDVLTLCLAHEVLTLQSIRKVARQTGCAPSTVSGALSRLEAAVAVPLVRRDRAASFVLTLEAQHRLPALTALVGRIRDFLREAGRPVGERPPAVGIKALLRFAAIAHSGSIRGSARSLKIGQPQLTRQMSDLERMLGATLLTRSAAGALPTALGERLLPIAEGIVMEWEALSHAASERFRKELATWRIGTVVPLGHESSIARMLARLTINWSPHQARHPLHISSHSAEELMAGLKSRRFDLIVVDHNRIPSDFISTTLSTTPLALVGQRRLMARTSDVAALLTDHPVVLPSQRNGIRQEAMHYMEGRLGREQLAAIPIVEIDSIPVIINLVAEHGYLSVLPQSAIARLPFDLGHVSLAPGHMLTLAMAWRRGGLPEALLNAVHRSLGGDLYQT